MVLIQYLFKIPSLRQTYQEIQVNVADRWFLGYNLLEEIPHFATVSYAFYNHFPPEDDSGGTVTKTVSSTDPDCGMFVKGSHERQFAYEAHTACDRHGGTQYMTR